jgi:phosphate uptake regulator
MELRKMQLVGRASFSVTLPPDWVKEYKLKPSDQITITRQDDGSLKLTPATIREEKKEIKITIDADRCKDLGLLKELILGGYIKGCDSIEVVSKHTISENHRREINDASNDLIGMGIVESTSNRVMLQSMVDASKFPVGPLLKRLYSLVSSMQEDTMKALRDKDPSLAANVIQRENEVNRIYSLARRQLITASIDKSVLKKIGLKDSLDLTYHIVALPRIKFLANYAVDIANNQLAFEKNVINDFDLQKLVLLGDKACEMFSNACEAFFKGDVFLAIKSIKSIDNFEEPKEELRKKLVPQIIKDTKTRLRLSDIIRDLTGVARYAMEIGQITIAKSVAEKSNLP